MSTDTITQIVILLFPVVSGIVAVAAKHLFTKLPAAQRDAAKGIIGEVVTAIEQTAAGMPGTDKKGQAEVLISQMLKDAKVSVTPTTLNTLLEAAVHTLNVVDITAAEKPVTEIK